MVALMALITLPSMYSEDKYYGEQPPIPTVGMTLLFVGPADVHVAHLAWVAFCKVKVLGNWDICASHWDIIEASSSQFHGSPTYQNS